VSVPRFPLRAAAALFVERQHLDRPRGRRLTAKSLAAFAESAGGIQLDSINVVDRAHYLTLWSRFGPYRRESLRRMIEKRRVLFEYWSHAACLVAASEFPAWRRVMLDYRLGHKRWGSFLKKNAALVREVEAAIRDRGPLGNADFLDTRKRGRGGGWWNWKPATHALDWLWMSGRTTVHSRVHFHKRFDLIERALPGPLAREPLTHAAFVRWHVETSLRAMGAASERDLSGYRPFPRSQLAERRAAMRAMVAEGAVVEVALDGDRGRWFALREDLDALAAAARRRVPARGAALLAPFDSLLWHRERAARLFGYDYRIEVYVPGHKRVHGYYSLPVFVDGHLIGRADAKNHRAKRQLELKHVHFEPWFVAGDPPPVDGRAVLDRGAALASVADAAASLAAFLGATGVKLARTSPAALHGPLRRAIEHAAIAPAAPVEDDGGDATADAEEVESELSV
jgi:uncharacterized protein YcaQ